MNIIKQCKYCGSHNLVLENKTKFDVMEAHQIPLKCADCGKWIKWCPKDERQYYINKVDKDQRIAELEEQLKNAIMPKFKIGQEVYFIDWDDQIRNGEIIDISYVYSRKTFGFNTIEYEVEYGNGYDEVESDWFSQTIVYVTKEEAEAKLKELQGE